MPLNISFGSRRPDWSQALRDAAAHVNLEPQSVTRFADSASHADQERARVYDPRQRTVIAARESAVQLARDRVPEHGAPGGDELLVQLALTGSGREGGSAGRATHGEASSSSAPPPTVPELGARLATGDMSALPSLMKLTKQAAQHACDAAEASRTGAMAALVASSHAGHHGLQTLTTRIEEASAHLEQLEFAVDAAGDDEDNETPPIREARAQILEARTALGTLHADLAHCLVQQAIGEHRLSSEATVLGHVAALRGLDPAVFEIGHGGGEPRVLDGMAELASNFTRDLRAMLGACDNADRALLERLGGGVVNVPQMLTEAADTIATLRSACPSGAAQEALGELFDAVHNIGTWMDRGFVPGVVRTTPAVSPQSPLRAPPSPALASGSATAVRERMDELARQRVALGHLPQIRARIGRHLPRGASQTSVEREMHNRIAQTIRGAIGPHTPPGTRAELARVAMHFATDNPVERNRLARVLTSAVLDVQTPTTGEVEEIIGGVHSASASAVALFDRLGDLMGQLRPEEAGRFARSIDHALAVHDGGRPYASVRRTAEAIAARQLVRHASYARLALPDGTAWLADGAQRTHWARTYVELCGVQRHDGAMAGAGHVDNQTAFLPVVALASDSDRLRGHRHHFVAFVKDLFQQDDDHIEAGYRPAVGSAQRFALLQAMVVQLPQFGTAAGDRQTVSDVLSLVFRQLDGKNLEPRHKARLVKDLLAVTGHLCASRLSASGAAQSYALDAIKAGLKHLQGQQLVTLLRHLLASSESWSAERSASGQLPRTRGQKLSYALSSILPPIGAMNAATYAVQTAIGRKSPRHEALRLVLETLEACLGRALSTGERAPAELIPVYGQLLRGLFTAAGQPDAKLDKTGLSRTLSCIVRGGLPVVGNATERNQFISDVLGDDPLMRAAVARVLTRAVNDRAGPASNPLARLGAARYLQNLIAAGAGSLSEAELQAAHAAINRAVSSKSVDMTDRQQQGVLAAMLREAQRDGMQIQPGLAVRTAAQTIASLQNAIAPEDAREAVKHMPMLVSTYSLLDTRTRNALKTALLTSLPPQPAAHGTPAAQRQLPLLGFVVALSHFAGNPQDAAELRELLQRAWPRLNPTNQEAALSDMFGAYDEATPAGRDMVLSVVSELGEPGQFVSAAIKLIENTVADDRMRSKLSDDESGRIVDAVLGRIRDLPTANASDLVSNVMALGDRLPQALIDGFVGAARKLHPRVLAEVLSAELPRVATLPAPEGAAALMVWRNIRRRIPLDSAQRDTLRLFATIAEEALPHLGTREAHADRVAVPADAAGQLLGALPTFTPQMQTVVLRHIAGEGAPADVRKSIVDDLFRDFATADATRRQLAMELGGPGAVGRGLEALAKEFGVPHAAAGGRVVRPGLDQPFIAPGGASQGRPGAVQTLESALRDPARTPEEIAVVLEAIAERFLALPKTDHQLQFERLFNTLADRLPPHLLGRVVDTLALANPSLAATQGRADELVREVTEIGRRLLQRHHRAMTPRAMNAVAAMNAINPANEVARARLREEGDALLRQLRDSRLAQLPRIGHLEE